MIEKFRMPWKAWVGLVLAGWAGAAAVHAAEKQSIPSQVPPRRSTQLLDGFGISTALPREPRLPWTVHWWTRFADIGAKFVRIGQYENSSERTSWDWIEQTPGHYATTADLDEAIRSLSDNGAQILIQLQYANPLYQGDPGQRPTRVTLPPPGIGEVDEPPNPIFIPPTTDEQIKAFLGYVRFMVNRYKDRVKYWELWEEVEIGYWRPFPNNKKELVEKARSYGRLLCPVADTIHQIDPEAKVMPAGGDAENIVFVQAAVADCPEKMDIIAYHDGFGVRRTPEALAEMAALFRERVRRIPGLRPQVEIWDNEWSSSGQRSESVQARYVTRMMLYQHAHQVRNIMWTLAPGTDGNEGDTYGVLHGDTGGPDSFQPRQSYRAWEVTQALFGQTAVDLMADLDLKGIPVDPTYRQLHYYAFRDRVNGKRIYAFWLAVSAEPGDQVVPKEGILEVADPELHTPILIDVRTGAVTPPKWTEPGKLRVPVTDSVMAVADASYLDWPALPEAPGALQATRLGTKAKLSWTTYDGARPVEVQRSVDYGAWQAAGRVAAGKKEFTETLRTKGHVTYRVRALSKSGPSVWSNPAWLDIKP